ELETAEQRLNAILGNLGEAVTVQDRSGRLVFANHAAADLLGAASVDELLAADPRELIGRFDAYNDDGTPLRTDQLPGRHVLARGRHTPRSVRRDRGDRAQRSVEGRMGAPPPRPFQDSPLGARRRGRGPADRALARGPRGNPGNTRWPGRRAA